MLLHIKIWDTNCVIVPGIGIISPEILVGPFDPKDVAAPVVLVQLRVDQSPVQGLRGGVFEFRKLARGQATGTNGVRQSLLALIWLLLNKLNQ